MADQPQSGNKTEPLAAQAAIRQHRLGTFILDLSTVTLQENTDLQRPIDQDHVDSISKAIEERGIVAPTDLDAIFHSSEDVLPKDSEASTLLVKNVTVTFLSGQHRATAVQKLFQQSKLTAATASWTVNLYKPCKCS